MKISDVRFPYIIEVQRRLDKHVHIKYEGTEWKIPVWIVVLNRAEYYLTVDVELKDLYDSVFNDTIPFFEDCDYNIENWVVGNMDWSDLVGHAEIVNTIIPTFKDAWNYCCGESGVEIK